MFQSTHPHGVRQLQPSDLKDVTSFNPRTRTGCDMISLRILMVIEWFQSTHPHGVRLGHYVSQCIPYEVSIHAPARGATGTGRGADTGRRSFNPRTRTGCDCTIADEFKILLTFQSTHPHGVRPGGCCRLTGMGRFQSTHPHGVRHCIVGRVSAGSLFQSTHPHGVRHPVLDIFVGDLGFNPRTRTGCD